MYGTYNLQIPPPYARLALKQPLTICSVTARTCGGLHGHPTGLQHDHCTLGA